VDDIRELDYSRSIRTCSAPARPTKVLVDSEKKKFYAPMTLRDKATQNVIISVIEETAVIGLPVTFA